MKHKTRGAALATAALVALIALFGMTGCPNNAGGGGTLQASLVSGGASLILSADKLTIKVTVKTADSSSVTVEGCTETTLTSDSETELHAKGTTVILKGRIIKLVCSDNRLIALNVQGLSALEELVCSDNRLTALNVQGLNALEVLLCGSNRLTELNVQGLSALKSLGCQGNRLTSLNVSGCTALKTLNRSSNKIAGKFAVPAFFNSLPDRLPADDARCYLYTEKAGVPEGNLTNFTGSSVATAFQNAKNRNWKMYKYDANGDPVEI